MLLTDEYVGFWGSVFSNFCDEHPIQYKSRKWLTSEHIFMYEKAMFFGDTEIAKKIMEAETPQKAKRLGKKVAPFNEEEWAKVREEKMLAALRAKFNIEEYKDSLLETGDRIIVEASPFDKIWGIGFDEDNMLKVSKDKWGLNLLGKCLMIIREEIREGLI